jgi:hypothetical protein
VRFAALHNAVPAMLLSPPLYVEILAFVFL